MSVNMNSLYQPLHMLHMCIIHIQKNTYAQNSNTRWLNAFTGDHYAKNIKKLPRAVCSEGHPFEWWIVIEKWRVCRRWQIYYHLSVFAIPISYWLQLFSSNSTILSRFLFCTWSLSMERPQRCVCLTNASPGVLGYWTWVGGLRILTATSSQRRCGTSLLWLNNVVKIVSNKLILSGSVVTRAAEF